MKNDFLLRISLVGLQLRSVFSQSPPRFVSTIKMLTTEPFFTTLLVAGAAPSDFVRSKMLRVTGRLFVFNAYGFENSLTTTCIRRNHTPWIGHRIKSLEDLP